MHAEQASPPPRIAILAGDSPIHRNGGQEFRRALGALGYLSGRTVTYHERFVRSPAQMSTEATQLVASNIDLLAAFTTQAGGAAVGATKTIPIVFALVTDLGDAGLFASLARRGGTTWLCGAGADYN